jgi:hypothetical protein
VTTALSSLFPEPSTREPVDAEGVKVAIAKMDTKLQRTERNLLSEMQKILGPDFSFDG